MKLADYVFKYKLTPEQLRRMLGVKNRSTVIRWLNNDCKPNQQTIAQIAKLTNGQVTEADFDDPSPPKCAAIIIDEHGQRRYVYPWSRGFAYQRAAFRTLLQEPVDDVIQEFSYPLARALHVLGDRAMFTKKGHFLLDGRISDARRIVKEANRLLIRKGYKVIHYPGVHTHDE